MVGGDDLAGPHFLEEVPGPVALLLLREGGKVFPDDILLVPVESELQPFGFLRKTPEGGKFGAKVGRNDLRPSQLVRELPAIH